MRDSRARRGSPDPATTFDRRPPLHKSMGQLRIRLLPQFLFRLLVVAVIHGLDNAGGFGVATQAHGERLAAFDGEANLVVLLGRAHFPLGGLGLLLVK